MLIYIKASCSFRLYFGNREINYSNHSILLIIVIRNRIVEMLQQTKLCTQRLTFMVLNLSTKSASRFIGIGIRDRVFFKKIFESFHKFSEIGFSYKEMCLCIYR